MTTVERNKNRQFKSRSGTPHCTSDYRSFENDWRRMSGNFTKKASTFAQTPVVAKPDTPNVLQVMIQLRMGRSEREYLRHLKWYEICLPSSSNDKKHGSWSSQTFPSLRLEFYDIIHKRGPDETLKFAWNDEVETERKKASFIAEKRSVCQQVRVLTSVENRFRGKLWQPLSRPSVTQGLLVMSNLTTSVVMFQRRSLREGMSRCRTKSFGCVRKEQTKQHISS
jgi:hypothetical protein